jgi:hypothetical protein
MRPVRLLLGTLAVVALGATGRPASAAEPPLQVLARVASSGQLSPLVRRAQAILIRRLRLPLDPQTGLPRGLLPSNVKLEQGLPPLPTRSYWLLRTDPVPGFRFKGSVGTTGTWKLVSRERSYTLNIPLGPGDSDIAERLARAISALPAPAARWLRGVTVNPVANPDDAKWAARYGRAVLAGMSAPATGVLWVYPHGLKQTEPVLIRNMVHELGHVWSDRAFGNWRIADTVPPAGWLPWVRAIASDAMVPSRYATAHAAEDVAESTLLYLSTAGTPMHAEYRRLFPARFALLDLHVRGGR